MIVYVESNFVLELTLEQEQHQSCKNIVAICESGNAHLVLPAFCIAEPYQTLGRRAAERIHLKTSLTNELRLLSRSQSYHNEIPSLQSVTDVLIRSSEEENRRLQQTLDRILKVAEIIPLDRGILITAAKLQIDHDLKPPDSIVYASILHHLSTTAAGSKCFLNRNSRDFDDPDIEAVLTNYGCKMLFSFDNGYGYIQSQILSTARP